MIEKDLSLTQKFDAYQPNGKTKVDIMLTDVKNAMLEKGYNPVNQVVGYILSGDPTYITSHKGARSAISKIERNELLEEIVKSYLNSL
nr:IreB family regulatory phosphoprotein [uncultured Tyzzerella sp.]